MGVTDDLAAELLHAERTRVAVGPPTERVPALLIADAYAIQRAGLGLRGGAESVVGHKIGLTSAAMQQMLGVDQPDFGYLTGAMVSASGCTLAVADFLAPRVEAEIAFRLARPLSGEDELSVADVLAATDAVAPAIEVIDSRIADWRLTIADTIADNASSGHVVLGTWRPLDDLDLAALEGELVVEGPDGRREAVHGRGDAVLGHPATAVAWLARALHAYGGERIATGEIVLSGAMARAVPVQAGDDVRADVGALGTVTARFAAPLP